MPLDPQSRAVVDHFNQFMGAALDVAQMRANAAASVPPLEHERRQVDSVADLDCAGPAGRIPLRVYRPKAQDAQGALPPLLVYFHGGGFVMGTLDEWDGLCCTLARASGCVVVSVAYRLAPEHKFPAAPQDCHAALTWVAAHGASLGGDPQRLAVAGDSAGGNLAAVVALMNRDLGGPRIGYQALLYPGTNGTGSMPSRQRNGQGYLLTSETLDGFASQALARPEDALDPRFAPLRAARHDGLPPALLITAEYDPLLDEGAAYAQRLSQSGVPVEYVEFDGTVHGFVSFYQMIDKGRQAIELVGERLRRAF